MKTMTVALVLATLIGCHKDKAKTATTTPTDKATPAATKQDKPAPNVTADEQVSPGLAISGDILAACGIKATAASANPKFDTDKDELAPEDRQVLDKIATCLVSGALKGKAVALIGRADPRGPRSTTSASDRDGRSRCPSISRGLACRSRSSG